MIGPKMPLHVSKSFDEALSAFLLRALGGSLRRLALWGTAPHF